MSGSQAIRRARGRQAAAVVLTAVLGACGTPGERVRVDVQGYCDGLRAVAERTLDAGARTRARSAHRRMSDGQGRGDQLLEAQREVMDLLVDYRVTRAFAAADGVCVTAACPERLDVALLVGSGDAGVAIEQVQALVAGLRGAGTCAGRLTASPTGFCEDTIRNLLHMHATMASEIVEVAAQRDAMPVDKPVGRAGLAGMVIEMEREARLAVAYAAVVVDTCVTPALRPACRQLLAAPNDDGPTLAAKLGAIDFAIKGRPCISDRP